MHSSISIEPIILASASPRRKELLESYRIPFKVFPSSIDEPEINNNILPAALALESALVKALSVSLKFPGGIILGADTLVSCENRILGKPESPEKAREMLMLLRDRWHSVYTGVAIIDTNTKFKIYKVCESKVKFKPLTTTRINEYIESGEPLDKAGAYGIQGKGGEIVDKVIGSFTNVVGLPMECVINMFCSVKPEFRFFLGNNSKASSTRSSNKINLEQKVLNI